MIKAVIFDMDGLMINSELVTMEGYQHVLEGYNKTMEEEFYKTFLGKPVSFARSQMKTLHGEDFPFEDVLKEVHLYMANSFETKGVPLKPGLIELLQYLKDENIKTIVATSSHRSRVDTILQLANLETYFNDSICGDEVERGKPFPDTFLNACKKLYVKPNEALVLEDSNAGIEAGYAAKIRTICVPDMVYPDKEHQEMTFAIVDTLKDVIDIVKKEAS
ncbi:HAD family hydrolase [Tannockella kyphosi]|uniref:HAD family hydrolase n=1 Tax=Tannockella kyphosi TaxID=2899121 RepID=UPI002012716F|nr:HAD family phosphatase [Tannockella kyphosi]